MGAQPELYVEDDGTKRCNVDGRPHRKDGPAVEHVDGCREWWVHGQLHSEDGPAVDYPDVLQEFYLCGRQIAQDSHADLVAMSSEFSLSCGALLQLADEMGLAPDVPEQRVVLRRALSHLTGEGAERGAVGRAAFGAGVVSSQAAPDA